MSRSDLNPDAVYEIAEAVANGRKIEAIKIDREVTGKGLSESKEFIDQLFRS